MKAKRNMFIREAKIKYVGSKLKSETIKDAQHAAKYIREYIGDQMDVQERFVTLYLDGSHQIISIATITTGTVNASMVHPREVYQRAVLLGAVAIIVAHNHPSGSTNPSNEDIFVTKRLKESGEILGIPMLDHVIVTPESYYSFTKNAR